MVMRFIIAVKLTRQP